MTEEIEFSIGKVIPVKKSCIFPEIYLVVLRPVNNEMSAGMNIESVRLFTRFTLEENSCALHGE